MSLAELHVLERGSQPVRGAARVAPILRDEMDARRITAKELAADMRRWASDDARHRWAPDYRTIQHAMAGTACALDTYLALAGYFGWDFSEAVQTPIHGADPLSAREAEVVRQLNQAAALQARLERDRAVRGRPPLGLGWLARRPSEERPFASSPLGARLEQAAEEDADALGPPNLDLFEGVGA
jgi:hypothetical protein